MSSQYDSPSPSRIRRPSFPSPSAVERSVSPANSVATEEYPETMPTKKKQDDVYDFFVKELSEEFLSSAAVLGIMFDYKFNKTHPHKRDADALKRYSSIMSKHLQRDPYAMFLKSDVLHALQRLQAFSHREFSTTLDLRLQAANYCRLYSDLWSIRRDSTTQARLPAHTTIILDLMKQPSDCSDAILTFT